MKNDALQRLFDDIAEHLLTQNKKSTLRYNKTRCRYRGDEEGTSCAIGCLIPDEMYDESMEGHGVSNLFYTHSIFKNFLNKKYDNVINTDEGMDLVCAMQLVHDAESVCDWKSALKKRAAKFNLDFNFDS